MPAIRGEINGKSGHDGFNGLFGLAFEVARGLPVQTVPQRLQHFPYTQRGLPRGLPFTPAAAISSLYRSRICVRLNSTTAPGNWDMNLCIGSAVRASNIILSFLENGRYASRAHALHKLLEVQKIPGQPNRCCGHTACHPHCCHRLDNVPMRHAGLGNGRSSFFHFIDRENFFQ